MLLAPLKPFAVTRHGELIQSLPVKSVRTGIDYSDARTDLGLVAEFEEREAATFAGISWPDWLQMDMRDRAATVAHYRIHSLVELHAHDAVMQQAKREAQ